MNTQKPEQVSLPEHYNVKRVQITVEIEPYDPKTGKVLRPILCDPHVMYEAEFPDGFLAYLKAKGLDPKPFVAPTLDAAEGDPTAKPQKTGL